MAYFTKMKIDYSMKFNSSSRNDHLSKFIKTMKKNRIVEQHNVQQIWSTIDCNFDPNIEFYCHGRLPVFNEWISSVAKDVKSLPFFFFFFLKSILFLFESSFKKSGQQVVLFLFDKYIEIFRKRSGNHDRLNCTWSIIEKHQHFGIAKL